MFVTARHYHGVSHCLGVQVPCWVADQGSDRPAVPVLAAPPPWFPALSCQRECPPGDRIRAAPPAPARQRGPGTLKQPSSPASSSGFRHPDLGRGQTGAIAGGHGVADYPARPSPRSPPGLDDEAFEAELIRSRHDVQVAAVDAQPISLDTPRLAIPRFTWPGPLRNQLHFRRWLWTGHL